MTATTTDTSKIQLKDKTELFYHVYKHDTSVASNLVILFLHGTPGSKLYLTATQAQSIPAQVETFICLERPGFGDSTEVPTLTLLQYAAMVDECLQQWTIQNLITQQSKICVMGYSGGGPFALACAHHLSHKLHRVAVIQSLCPRHYHGSTDTMPMFFKFGFWVSSVWPSLATTLVKMDTSGFCDDPEKGICKAYADNPIDVQFLKKNKEAMDLFKQNAVALYSKNKHHVETREYHLFATDWGFDLAKIATTVYLFHGMKDVHCVPNMAKILSSNIPNCKPKYYDTDAHCVFFTQWNDIMKEFLQ